MAPLRPLPNLLENMGHLQGLMKHWPLGLISDLDGTLAPIVATPGEARISEACRGSLRALVGKLPLVAIVSGRAVADVRSIVGLEGIVYVGNHGLEWWEGDRTVPVAEVASHVEAVRQVAQSVRERLSIPGMVVEDKGPVVAFHYRRAARPEEARAEIFRAVHEARPKGMVKIGEGRMVVEVRPSVEVDKGWAVKRLVQGAGLSSAVYLGDDLTDVDGFRALRSLGESGGFRGLSVAVVGLESPQALLREADVCLDGVDQVGRLLRWLEGELAEDRGSR